MTTPEQIQELLTRGVSNVTVQEELEKKLASGTSLRIKHGVDPTTTDLHLGYATIYLKLRDLQELGHTIVFLIGGFTARFGDPTDKDESRPMRTKEEIDEKSREYIDQLNMLLDTSKIEVRNNAEWFDTWSFEDGLHLLSNTTVARMLERDMFDRRMKEGKDIRLHEITYPLLQGYDSVELKSDVTVIGTDQTFNELQARPLQEAKGQAPQDLIAMKLLVGTDGTQKMSQSLGNDIKFRDKPNDMYGKVMAVHDDAIFDYFELVTRVPMNDISDMKADVNGGANPRNHKMRLAREIVMLFHGSEAALAAEQAFIDQFQKGKKPETIEEFTTTEQELPLVELLVTSGLSTSKSEARRVIEQGGVRVNDEVQTEVDAIIDLTTSPLLQVGKRHFKQVKKA